MTKLTRAQAIQTAVVAEKAASEFYARLARNTNDPEAKQLLQRLAEDELDHVEQLQTLATRLGEPERPEVGVHLAEGIEIRDDWWEAENLTLKQAIDLAIEGERNAVITYAALAEDTEPDVQAFFRGMSKVEQQHASWLINLKAKLYID